MKYLITGYKGQLGYDIKRELLSRGIDDENIIAIDKDEMDITDFKSVENYITNIKPDVIFHCAAYTNVDRAEEDMDTCYNVNVLGTKNISLVAKSINCKLFYISTDYVFDGTKLDLYNPSDKTNPMSVYGKTKYLGELEALKNNKTFVVRTAWVFGINGNNFIKTMLKLSLNHDMVSVVDDQFGSPTYTVDLSRLLVDMADTEKYGIYHATNDGFCSWAEFAQYILNDTNTEVKYVSTEDYYKPQYECALNEGRELHIAYRPRNSKLSKEKLIENGFSKLPEWKDAVDRYKVELKKVRSENR